MTTTRIWVAPMGHGRSVAFFYKAVASTRQVESWGVSIQYEYDNEYEWVAPTVHGRSVAFFYKAVASTRQVESWGVSIQREVVGGDTNNGDNVTKALMWVAPMGKWNVEL